jgi:triosephosphate isomerase (TIM)
MRAKVIAGNWKMNHGPEGTRRYFEGFRVGALAEGTELLVFPPIASLTTARDALAGRGEGKDGDPYPVALGIQNVHPDPAGAFTGETSAEMARECGASHALVGHSERRHVFGETDEDTAEKVAAAYRVGLTPVLCVGETLEERRAGRLEQVLVRQLDAVIGLPDLRDRIASGAPFLVAYEPVWAIGTGETATPGDASGAHGLVRARLRNAVGEQRSAAVPILYGGSVNPGNAGSLLEAEDVDGVLVGGASLEPESFARIAEQAPGG